MQFLRNGQKNAFMAVRCMSNSTTKPKKLPKTPRYTPQNQQILDEMMIPGPALRFFKTKKERKRPEMLDIVREKKMNRKQLYNKTKIIVTIGII